ncbi:MAG: 2,3-bisphosphoglycerate-independent phosphoglycerate mutase [bacterium]
MAVSLYGHLPTLPLGRQLRLSQHLTRRRSPDAKILCLVIDGLGGLDNPASGISTELEEADHPHLDVLAQRGDSGLVEVLGPYTPGSEHGHFAIFGYDPNVYIVSRGVIDAMGAGIPLQAKNVVARANLTTLDENGVILDRRAGRLSTERTRQIVDEHLSGIEVDGVRVVFEPTKDHRLALILQGDNLSAEITGSDQDEGKKPNIVAPEKPGDARAERTARIVNEVMKIVEARLAEQTIAPQANTMLFRAFGKPVRLPSFAEVYGLNAATVAVYPAYKGIGRVMGMTTLDVGGAQTINDQFRTVAAYWDRFDFFFVHIKGTDSAGEDGDFKRKVEVIEAVDRAVPILTALLDLDRGDTFAVTADHSTPALLRGHSWHTVPFLVYSKSSWGSRSVTRFSDLDPSYGELGTIAGLDVMPFILENTGRRSYRRGWDYHPEDRASTMARAL